MVGESSRLSPNRPGPAWQKIIEGWTDKENEREKEIKKKERKKERKRDVAYRSNNYNMLADRCTAAIQQHEPTSKER